MRLFRRRTSPIPCPLQATKQLSAYELPMQFSKARQAPVSTLPYSTAPALKISDSIRLSASSGDTLSQDAGSATRPSPTVCNTMYLP